MERVAGLQTLNKPYLATSDNINYFTNARFNPKGQLNEKVITNFNNHHDNKVAEFKATESFKFEGCDQLGIILNNNDLSLNEVFDKQKINYHSCLFAVYNKNKLISEFHKNFIKIY